MGLFDAMHSMSDLRSKKHDRRLRSDESAAKVNHAKSEAGRIDAEAQARLAATELEKRKLNHLIEQDRIKMTHEHAKLNAQISLLNHGAKTGADIEFHGVRVRYHRAPVSVTEEQPAITAAELPGRVDLTEILERWRPSQQQILLGLAPGGGLVTVPAKDLCHVALAGATGGGKSNLMRLLLAQLLFAGCKVLIADPHFTPYDLESGEDWQPIADRLMMEPATDARTINEVLRWAATSELPKRLALRHNKQNWGRPLFIAMDEFPSIVAKCPDVPDYVSEIAREGRKVYIYLVASAQDFLVKTIKNSNVRDNFRTALYVGGDQTSGRVLLDVTGRVDDGSLGKGVVMCRSQATPQASLIRVPYVSNQALYRLLPVNGGTPVNDGVNGVGGPIEPVRNTVNSTLKRLPEPQNEKAETFTPPPFGVTQKQLDQIKALHGAEISLREIARIVKLDGRHYGAFREACKYLGINQEGGE